MRRLRNIGVTVAVGLAMTIAAAASSTAATGRPHDHDDDFQKIQQILGQTGKLLSELDKRAAAAHQNQTNGRQGAWLDAPSGAGHSGSEPKNRFRPK